MIAILVATAGGTLATLSCSSDAPATSSSPPTVKIVRPKDGQSFKPSDTITLEGTGVDDVEGDIAKAPDVDTRMIWKGGFGGRAVDPAGEGPTDSIGPLDAGGTFTIRFEVTNKSGQTGSDQISIKVQ
jgi:hypothetical protein